MIYKDKLEAIREDFGVTQRSMSKLLGLNIDVYGQYEREYYIMPLKHLINVCDYFNISLDYVFSFTKKKSYKNINKIIDKNIVGQRLKEFRKEYKMSQKELANILNVVNTIISKYERGDFLIATHTLYTICKKYNISADYLLGRIDEPKYLDK